MRLNKSVDEFSKVADRPIYPSHTAAVVKSKKSAVIYFILKG